MKNLFLLLTLTIGGFTSVNAQKVYSVDADYKAGDNDGKWYFTDADYKAKKKIYFVDADYKADIKIYFVNSDYKAGWKNSSKKAEMY